MSEQHKMIVPFDRDEWPEHNRTPVNYFNEKPKPKTKERYCYECGIEVIGFYKIIRGKGYICKDCYDYQTTMKKEHEKMVRDATRDLLVELGICPTCKKDEQRSGVTGGKNPVCEVCWAKNLSYDKFKNNNHYQDFIDLWNKQGGRCPYTGTELIRKENCHLDHIIPKSKGGEESFNNYQFVLDDVNQMKGRIFHEDFLDLVKKINDYCN